MHIRLDLILETFCNLNDSMVTQYNLWRVTKKITGQKYISGTVINTFSPLEHHSTCLSKSLSIQDKINSNVLFCTCSGEKKINSTVFQTHGRIFSLIFSKALNITVIPGLMKLEALLRHTMSEGKEHRSFLSLRAQTFLELEINSITCGMQSGIV